MLPPRETGEREISVLPEVRRAPTARAPAAAAGGAGALYSALTSGTFPHY